MIDLRYEPEIFPWHRDLPQIMDADGYVANIHLAVGFATRCFKEDGVFDTDAALRIANELCAYIRYLTRRSRHALPE